MRILLATYFISPHVGGVWQIMLQLKKRLEYAGHQVDLFASGPDHQSFHMPCSGRTLYKELIRPLLVTKINAALYPDLAYDPWIYHFELENLQMELAAAYFGVDQYDVIHTQDIFAARAFSRVKSARTPLIASLHGSVAEEYKLHFIQVGENLTTSMKWAYHAMYENIGAVSANVTTTSNYWLKHKLVNEFSVPDEKIRVFPYGYDVEGFTQKMMVPSSLTRPPGLKVIFFAGRLVAIKGVHVLLSALAELMKWRQDWVLWIAGEGPEAEGLRQQSAALGLEHVVQFLGSRDDVPYLLSLADICVTPSLLDNQPLSVIEAQIAGKAVVVSNAAGLPEMVEQGVTGIIFPSGDIHSLCYNLNELLGNDIMRQALGNQARQWAVQHWSYELMFQRFLELYYTEIARLH
ncbi:glycosyltransferase family 4 protein [Paenibacillus larvae]|uniref:Putative glycosyltransferase YpjH n=2 Tax=Paenibacillus larvae TaxID=1464 RepID=A0A6C0QYZ5_9BACL|nr:glycosyltransferase family 4 protein [Paenibacillus larvae]MCY9511489.1 glycosyltransferase family 4 protein [Paenibacillus larvae]MCY9526540.1 glycosyltransferase family 4 protein [Paenibacillus larvae]QHZ53933.1 putative glycosyltransferase YpjH [Paenibacillus larvae subsp. larvae]